MEEPSDPERREDQDTDLSAPEGAACAQHPERPAAFTCPRCGNYNCVFCFHPVPGRCEACLKRDPAAAAPPVPWETTEGSALSRFGKTLADGFSPVRTAPAFATPELARARTFFLLTALPLAALAGVIPNTKTLMFGGNFAITVQGKVTASEIALDVLQAMGIQLAMFCVHLAVLAAPYLSLVRAYAVPEHRNAAGRVLLYRAWLLPSATLLFFLGAWALPAEAFQVPLPDAPKPPKLHVMVALTRDLLSLGTMLLNVLLLVAMRSTARLACGIPTLLSYVVVGVPLVLVAVLLLLFGQFLT